MSDCKSDIVKYYVVQPTTPTGVITGSTGDFIVGKDLYICSGTTFTDVIDPCNTGVTINSNVTFSQQQIIPTSDGSKDLGTPSFRFRNINTISGTSTVWTSTDRVITPNLDLGLDSSGNTRTITANNSIIQDDCLLGGTY